MSRPEKTGKNFIPLPYRQVSVQPYHGPMTPDAITAHLLGKDSYRRTGYVILEQPNHTCAIASVSRQSNEPLFSPITAVDVLALPETCVLVEDETVDTGNPSALGAKALELGLGPESTLVVRGLYGHVNFIHRPDPIKIRLVEVTPPDPPKLMGLARQVLTYADLPPIHLEPHYIDLRDLSAQAPQAEAFLIPCRASGLNFDVPTYFLDEHPDRRNWTMLACERSRQIHHHFYGDDAPRVEMCPRKLAPDDNTPTLLKCCLLEEHIQVDGNRATVPWGANLKHVEEALRTLVNLETARLEAC